MPKRVLRFHFDYISPYSYLAWQQLGDFANEHELRVEPKPTLFAGLLNHLGHKGPAEIEPKRIYMFKDCHRAAAQLGVPDALERIQAPEIKQRLLQATREAIENGVFGVPTMIVDDELFWGTDSFPHLARYLRGEDPVRPKDVDAWLAVTASAQRK